MPIIMIAIAGSIAAHFFLGLSIEQSCIVGLGLICAMLFGENRQLQAMYKVSSDKRDEAEIRMQAAELFYWNAPSEQRVAWNNEEIPEHVKLQRRELINKLKRYKA